MKNIPSLKELIYEFNNLPGVGLKTAERLAYFVLHSPRSYAYRLSESLKRVKELIHECPQCFAYTEDEFCSYCVNPLRQKNIICVVENPNDLWKIESSGVFNGLYHVLRGVISPLKNISASDLTMQALIHRVQGIDHKNKEVILAFNSDIEGETTSLYITKKLRSQDIKITRMAQGLPIGAHIDYTDEKTLGKALENRMEMELE